MKINDPQYIENVFEFGYFYSMKNFPEKKEVSHYQFAEQCALKAENRARKFYQGTSKYTPHQGHKETARRAVQNG